jgi:uncharacterized SAM-binding protein YcdF (DUF218 family)
MPGKAWRGLAEVLARPLRVEGRGAGASDGGASDLAPAAHAIIVLGAPLAPDGRLSALAGERVRAAAELWHLGGARHVVVSGGVTRGAARSEAQGMAEGLVALGVSFEQILLEERSLTTAENAERCAELLGVRGGGTATRLAGGALVPPEDVWLVTQPFHARRARRYFRRAGFSPRVWHIADSITELDPRAAVRWSLREYLAWVKALTWG